MRKINLTKITGKLPKRKKHQKDTETPQTGKRRRKFRLFSFSRKILLLCLLPMLIICFLISSYSSRSLSRAVENEIQGALEIVAISLDETYSNLYKGDYEIGLDGTVTKGDQTISRNTDLINALKERTNFDITLYFNQTRLITTLRNEKGVPVTGTPADEKMYKQIMKNKTVFQPNVTLYNKLYYVYYQPLVNADGTVVGAIGVAKEAATVQKTISTQTRQITLMSFVILLVMAVFIILIATRMVSVMKSTKHYLYRLADGEFGIIPNQKLMKRNDELGDIYNSSVQLQNELRKIVDHIKDSSADLIQSADQLTDMAQNTRNTVDSVCSSMKDVTDGSVTQSEKTTVAIDHVTKIGEEITYISETMDSLTKHAGQMSDAEKTSKVILNELNDSNDETIATITDIADQILALHESVESIRSAITMIQGIADETDLLSLNANIEAARAGEAGRGFSVVATQISKLAEQSNNTATDVEHIISDIISESDKMVSMIDELKDKIHQQQLKLTETINQTDAVSSGINNSLEDIQTIRTKIGVLSDSGDNIQDIVKNLASISEKNEATTQDTMDSAIGMSQTMNSLENSSEKLKGLANALDETLVMFKM